MTSMQTTSRAPLTEFPLLLACSAWPHDEQRLQSIRAASQHGVDWPMMIRLARRHRVAALVQHALEAARVPLPCQIEEELRTLTNATAHRELLCASETVRLHGRLAEAGKPVIALKGVALAMRAYGRLGLRYNHDIDLLVSPSDAVECAKLIETMGYVRARGSDKNIEDVVGHHARLHKDLQFNSHDGQMIVELHWRLFDNPFALPKFDAFADARSISITPAHAVKGLTPQMELVYLCRHGAEHAWSRLKWLADVNALFYSLGWSEVARAYAKASEMGVKRAFYSALLLCNRLFGAPVPKSLLTQVDQGWPGRMVVGAAIRAMSFGGAAEIEHMQFETTRKNISHYLLRDHVAYWWRELQFDLTDMPGANQAGEVGPVQRVSTWIQRHRRPLANGPW